MSVRVTKAELIDRFRQLKAAYQLAFGGAHGGPVLADLKKYCRADSSCFHEDPRVHAAREGAREVYLRIQDFLTMQPEAMADIAMNNSGKFVPNEGDHDD